MTEEGFEPQLIPQNHTDIEKTALTYLADLGLKWEDLQGKKVLDLGAGIGNFAQAAKSRGINVVSVDAHPEWWGGLEKLQKDIPFVIGNGKNLPFQDSTFDIIVARASLHSIVDTKPELEIALKEAKRVLKNGGEFRFGPGSINTKALNEQEWNEWKNLLDKHFKQEEFTAEEDRRGQELSDRLEESEKDKEGFDTMTQEERMARLSELSLRRLQSIDSNITVHEGNTARGKYSDTYYVMKK